LTKYPIHLTPERSEKIRELASNRQTDLAIVLENVHDPHNIGAVIRTCDAVGIPKVFLLVSDSRVWENIEIGINASSGARKWVDVYIYDNYDKCFADLRKSYSQLVGTHLSSESVELYDVDLKKSTAIVLGNEHDGLSKEALSYLDGNFTIPQFGMVQSLNISVACAISAYEALRQRLISGQYSNDKLTEPQETLHQDYRQRNFIQHKGNRGNIVTND
jgi:tRNA (guanosine-2'-O-)-methyltransferase